MQLDGSNVSFVHVEHNAHIRSYREIRMIATTVAQQDVHCTVDNFMGLRRYEKEIPERLIFGSVDIPDYRKENSEIFGNIPLS